MDLQTRNDDVDRRAGVGERRAQPLPLIRAEEVQLGRRGRIIIGARVLLPCAIGLLLLLATLSCVCDGKSYDQLCYH